MIREKQQDNPDYGFLFGGDGHGHYRYRLWLATHPPGGPFNPPFPSSSIPMMHPPNPMMNPSPLNAPPINAAAAAAGVSASMMGAPQMHQPPFAPFYDQQQMHPQPFGIHGRPDYDQTSKSFRGLSGPLPSDVAMELNNVLNNLNGTKESIKGAKNWFMQRSPFAPALAEALRDRIFVLDDSERQLHIIYLANDILFDRYYSCSFIPSLCSSVTFFLIVHSMSKISFSLSFPFCFYVLLFVDIWVCVQCRLTRAGIYNLMTELTQNFTCNIHNDDSIKNE
jgi:hypothetical protein